MGLFKLLRAYEDKSGYTQCTIGYKDGETEEIFVGKADGNIVFPRGRKGFGFDSIFEPLGHELTFGEMAGEEKDKLSSRFKAITKLRAYLDSKE